MKSARVVPFDLHPNVGSINVRLAPIDVGYDLRGEGTVVELPADTSAASYADAKRGDSADDRYVVEGTVREIAEVLRLAGYQVRIAAEQ